MRRKRFHAHWQNSHSHVIFCLFQINKIFSIMPSQNVILTGNGWPFASKQRRGAQQHAVYTKSPSRKARPSPYTMPPCHKKRDARQLAVYTNSPSRKARPSPYTMPPCFIDLAIWTRVATGYNWLQLLPLDNTKTMDQSQWTNDRNDQI